MLSTGSKQMLQKEKFCLLQNHKLPKRKIYQKPRIMRSICFSHSLDLVLWVQQQALRLRGCLGHFPTIRTLQEQCLAVKALVCCQIVKALEGFPKVKVLGYSPVVQALGYFPAVKAQGYPPIAKALGYFPTAKALGYFSTAKALGYFPTAKALAYSHTVKTLGYFPTIKALDYSLTVKALGYSPTIKLQPCLVSVKCNSMFNWALDFVCG